MLGSSLPFFIQSNFCIQNLRRLGTRKIYAPNFGGSSEVDPLPTLWSSRFLGWENSTFCPVDSYGSTFHCTACEYFSDAISDFSTTLKMFLHVFLICSSYPWGFLYTHRPLDLWGKFLWPSKCRAAHSCLSSLRPSTLSFVTKGLGSLHNECCFSQKLPLWHQTPCELCRYFSAKNAFSMQFDLALRHQTESWFVLSS